MAGRRKLSEIWAGDYDLGVAMPATPGDPLMAGPGPASPPLIASDPDRELLRRHVAGDPEAFGKLFLRHKERLWAVALRTACDPDDAADALQEAMVSAFRRAGDFRGESAVTTWLHRIVVNAAVDRLRRRPAKTANWPSQEGPPDNVAAAGPPPAPDQMDATEVRLDVTAALRHLPDQQRIALVLVDMLGYPVAEASEILGVSVGTIKSRCARGRARLLPYLSHLRTNFQDGGNRTATLSVSSEPGGDGREGDE
jgi:RNA polymerase sigma-70 factor (ECF subfamily)